MSPHQGKHLFTMLFTHLIFPLALCPFFAVAAIRRHPPTNGTAIVASYGARYNDSDVPTSYVSFQAIAGTDEHPCKTLISSTPPSTPPPLSLSLPFSLFLHPSSGPFQNKPTLSTKPPPNPPHRHRPPPNNPQHPPLPHHRPNNLPPNPHFPPRLWARKRNLPNPPPSPSPQRNPHPLRHQPSRLYCSRVFWSGGGELCREICSGWGSS